MRRNTMTMAELLLEAVGIVEALIYIVMQIFYSMSYDVPFWSIFMNIVAMLLVYSGLTLLSIYPEKVNGLTREVCSGKVRVYTLRMVRFAKLVFVTGLLFTSICDVLGYQINQGYSIVIVVLILLIAFVYEAKIIHILRENRKK